MDGPGRRRQGDQTGRGGRRLALHRPVARPWALGGMQPDPARGPLQTDGARAVLKQMRTGVSADPQHPRTIDVQVVDEIIFKAICLPRVGPETAEGAVLVSEVQSDFGADPQSAVEVGGHGPDGVVAQRVGVFGIRFPTIKILFGPVEQAQSMVDAA